MMSKNADGQRAGIEGSLSQVAESFRQVPPADGRPTWSVSEYVQHRRGNLFFTNDANTRTGLRPLQTLWTDMLIRGVLTAGERADLPEILLVIDEAALLKEIGQLASAFREMRKMGLMIVVAYHDQGSLKVIYGEEAESIFGGPETKIILRVGEPNSADWASRMIGEQDVERVREHRGTKGECTYTTEIAKNERAVMASQLSGLRPRRGYLRYGDFILPLTVSLAGSRPDIAVAFLPRTGEPVETRPMPNLAELRQKKEQARQKAAAALGAEEYIYRPDEQGENGGPPPPPELQGNGGRRGPNKPKKGPRNDPWQPSQQQLL